MQNVLTILTVVLFSILLGCGDKAITVSITPITDISSSITLKRDSSSTCRVKLECEPGIYSDHISAEIRDSHGNRVPYEYATSSIVSYRGAVTSANVTVALHAYPTAPKGSFTLYVEADNQGVKSTLNFPLKIVE